MGIYGKNKMTSTSQELETKFYITNPEALETKLNTLGAEMIQVRTHEYNLRFDTPDQKLAQEFRLLRLRKDQITRLTYKGPATNQGGVNVREEIEITVGDFETTIQLLHALGYQVTAIYEKYRTTYKLYHNHITIDEMPFGFFVEVEGLDKERIKATAKVLGLNWNANISENYLMIFYRLKEVYHLDFNEMTFENFKGIEIDLELAGIRAAR